MRLKSIIKKSYLLMFYRFLSLFFFPLLLLGLTSCQEDTETIPEVPDVALAWSLERADKVMVQAENIDQIQEYLQEHPRFARLGLGMGLRPEGDGPLLRSLFRLTQDPKIDSLHQVCMEEYGEDLNELETEFDHAFKRLKHLFPDFTPPVVYTVVTGLGYDLILKDSLLIVGLDYYLGKEHFPVAPPDQYGVPLPNYIWERYSPQTIVPHSILFLSNQYNRKDMSDRRLINDMITWGKVIYLSDQVLPAVPDHILIGYTEKQFADTQASAEAIYRFFVEKQLFFDASREAKTKYVHERPFTNELDQRAPGRLGVWLGWKIVQAYMEKHPEVSVQELMQKTDAQALFEAARYRP